MSRFLLFASTLFLSTVFFAQEHSVKYLDISSGLSNNSVNAVYQDNDGYIWFGTYDGLNRYDGYEFKIFRNQIDNKNSLAANYIFCIEGDSKNNIWIGGSKGGSVYSHENNNFSRLKLTADSKIITDGISQIRKVNNSLMLAGCSTSGLVAFFDGSYIGKIIPLKIKGKEIFNYHVTGLEPVQSEGFCWVFIRNFGLYKFWINKQSLELVSAVKQHANVIRQDKNHIVWIGTDDGLYSFKTQNSSFSSNQLIQKSIVTNILVDKKNNIYIATDGNGVFFMDKERLPKPLNGSSNKSFLKSDAVWGLYEDKDGNKWFGTLRGGVSMVGNSKRYFKHIILPSDDPSVNYILSFCEDKDRNIWIGTDGAGIRVWNRKNNSFRKITKKDGLSSNFIPGITSDHNNNLWIATWDGGINRIDSRTNLIKYYKLLNSSSKREEKNVWFIFEDSERTLWASSTSEGSLYYFNESSDKFIKYKTGLSELLCMTQSRNGKLWAGNYTDLFMIDKRKSIVKSKNLDYPIRCILEGDNNILWIGTLEGGLLKYNTLTGKYKRYTVKEGLPGNTVLRILKDNSGFLWLSTYEGLSRFDHRKDLFRNFSVSDGLQSKQFSYNAAIALSSGEFLFGGINGFNLFVPDSVKNISLNEKLLLSDIQVNNSSVFGLDYFESTKKSVKKLKIPFDQTLSLDFVALDYENADKINYAYCLKGWDEHWNFVGKNRKANYARLTEGTYVFKVKATNSYGKWGKEVTLLIVHVLPPWYRTWWAYLIYTLMMAGCIIGYIRYNKYKERLRYEVKLAHMESLKEKELSEKQVSMFTYISHEFRTPLSLIINPIKNVIRKQIDKGQAIPELDTAYRNATRLLSLIDQLLVFRRAENDVDDLKLSTISLNKLFDMVYQCFIQQSKEQDIKFTLEVPENEILIIGDHEKIEISLFNLISNAFKFTPTGGEIKIDMIETEEEVFLNVSDNGAGIPEKEQEYIFEKFRQVNLNSSPGKGFGIGLYIVKYFILKHKGTIHFESRLGEGSIFSIGLRKGSEHFVNQPINEVPDHMSELVKELAGDNLYETVIEDTFSATIDVQFSNKLNDELVSEKRSILIIDDNSEIRKYLIGMFSSSYIVYSADNGIDGFKLVKKYFPDVVISDIAMEGMTGLELCKRIKETEGISHTIVILLTATTNTETQLQGINEGADHYITKPFDSDILLAKVETLIKNRSHLRRYFLDKITLRENDQKVPAEFGDFLKRCIEVVDANINNENFNIKQFAKEMGMSHSGLYTKLKAISGQTLNGFIRAVRLRRAAVLMLTEDIQIAQAASQVGFEDRKHFREHFVKLFGMTPSDYIKKYRHTFNKELNVIQK